MAVRVVMAREREVWNAAVMSAPRADLLQSWEWGEFKRLSGWEPMRALVMDDEQPVAGAQLLARRVMGVPSLYAPRGPWWRDDSSGQAGLRALAGWLRRQRPGGAPFLRIDPPVTEPDCADGAGIPAGAAPGAAARDDCGGPGARPQSNYWPPSTRACATMRATPSRKAWR